MISLSKKGKKNSKEDDVNSDHSGTPRNEYAMFSTSNYDNNHSQTKKGFSIKKKKENQQQNEPDDELYNYIMKERFNLPPNNKSQEESPPKMVSA